MNEQARPRIAICEDEHIIALDLRNFLLRSGFDVTGIFDTAEGLLAAVEADRPDLTLMDIQLRGAMDGLDAAAVLLSRYEIPVIILTAFADDRSIHRAKLTQPFAYVLKPYDDRELKTAIEVGLYRSAMERKLKRSEARYRTLFEGSLAAVFVADSDGLLLQGNGAFSALAPGARSLYEAFGDRDRVGTMLARLASDGRFGPEEMPLAEAGDGARRWALVSAARLYQPAEDGTVQETGDESAYQFQAFDITERLRLQEGLARAQKMEALGRLAGGAAHDFNNIITAVLGYAHLAKRGLGQDSAIGAELDGIEAAARRAAVLARQLLVFSRREKPELSVFALSILARDLTRMLERLAGEDISIRLVPSEHVDLVEADRPRIEQVMVNLVMNARDAMDSGGRITIWTGIERLDGSKKGAFGPIPAGDWACLRVIDEGTGIPPENLPRLFEPFFSTKGPERGTGLGLATVAAIVRQAEGHIAVESRLGSGTTFSVYLPQAAIATTAEAASAGTGSDAAMPRAPRGSGQLVLVVEDDDSVRLVMESMLERCGYAVITARHPGEALILLENAKRRPRILVTDVVMPLMRGPELSRRIRTMVPGIATLYISGHESYAEYAGAESAEPCLRKPFTELELAGAIDGLLDQDRMER